MTHITNLYRGYSTFNFQITKSLELNDIELVERDLISHIFTIKGSRVMMPDFGSDIPTMTFEPLDELLVDDVYTELFRIFSYDPRVEIINLRVVPNFEESSILVLARLRYIELDTVDSLELNIEFEGG